METNTITKIKGAALTTAGGIMWGLSGSMGQYLFSRQGMDSRWLVPIRLGLAGIILLIFSIIKKGSLTFKPWCSKRDAIDLILYGLAGVSFCQFLYFTTIQLSNAGAATILQDVSPIMILLYSCLAAKRKPRPVELIAIALAFAGVYLITTHGDPSSAAVPVPAIITGVLSAVCVTIYNVTPGRLMSKYPVYLMQGWAFLMGSVVISLIFRPWTYGYVPNAVGCLGISVCVLVGNIIAFPAYILGVKYIGPEKGILYGFSEPITAAVIGVLLLGNSFSLWDLVGFSLVFFMLVLISTPSSDARR